MSTGRTHIKASLILTGGFMVGTLLSGDWSNIQYCFGSLIGVVITPDTDVDNGFETDKLIRDGVNNFIVGRTKKKIGLKSAREIGKRLGKNVEKIWDAIWYMYRRSLKHGGELSHLPPIGTFGRIAYLFGELIALPHVVYYILFQPAWNLWAVFAWYWGWLFVFWKVVLGLVCADFIHWVLDISTKNAE